ncbi:DUF5714 domain-containing protein [Desulfobulbus oralis]|nr:DUF5714 domain-containing protein [Desulfobulbus oralis]
MAALLQALPTVTPLHRTIIQTCMQRCAEGKTALLDTLECLMDLEGVPMHGPVHHFIVPAALLTAAAKQSGLAAEILEQKLHTASQRAEKVLPGFCGLWACCGAALGCGIFASVWLEANPHQEQHWGTVNLFTAACLAHVASVGGPRCCKRTSYLALDKAARLAPERLGVGVGVFSKPACRRNESNKACRKEGCPFYPVKT